MFQKGFLLTSNICAWNIVQGITETRQKATAVLGDVNYVKGHRVNILKVAYCSFGDFREEIPNDEYDIGVVMASFFRNLTFLIIFVKICYANKEK